MLSAIYTGGRGLARQRSRPLLSSCPPSTLKQERALSAHFSALGFALNRSSSWKFLDSPVYCIGFLQDLLDGQKPGKHFRALWHLGAGFALSRLQLLGGNFSKVLCVGESSLSTHNPLPHLPITIATYVPSSPRGEMEGASLQTGLLASRSKLFVHGSALVLQLFPVRLGTWSLLYTQHGEGTQVGQDPTNRQSLDTH